MPEYVYFIFKKINIQFIHTVFLRCILGVNVVKNQGLIMKNAHLFILT